jgi:cytochrome c oxidase subunit 3
VSIFRQLTEKPWLVNDPATARDLERDPEPVSAAPTGLKVYFAVATVMFGLFGAMYVLRMGLGHIGEGLDWRSTPKPWLLWLNTGFLVFSSVFFQLARNAARRHDRERLTTALLIAGLLTFAFVGGQLAVWRQFIGSGLFAATNPANAFFYLLTAVHGVHVLGGLIAWVRTLNKIWNGVEPEKVRLSVDLCATYWHFLLIAWLAFFYLILVT